MKRILIEISPGELLDRISIVQLKVNHARNVQKRSVLTKELRHLLGAKRGLPSSTLLDSLFAALQHVNTQLWNAEDQIRMAVRHRRTREIRSIAVAICRANDRRIAIRQEINQLAGAAYFDQKVYLKRALGHHQCVKSHRLAQRGSGSRCIWTR